jgi:hypothetical protein
VTGSWRDLHNEELQNFYSWPDIIRVIKQSRKWTSLKACNFWFLCVFSLSVQTTIPLNKYYIKPMEPIRCEENIKQLRPVLGLDGDQINNIKATFSSLSYNTESWMLRLKVRQHMLCQRSKQTIKIKPTYIKDLCKYICTCFVQSIQKFLLLWILIEKSTGQWSPISPPCSIPLSNKHTITTPP